MKKYIIMAIMAAFTISNAGAQTAPKQQSNNAVAKDSKKEPMKLSKKKPKKETVKKEASKKGK